MKKLIAGNWKMNNSLEESVALATALNDGLNKEPSLSEKCDFLIAPPFIHLSAVRKDLHNSIALSAQDCSAFSNGAHTGDVSARQLADMGCTHVIIGHSERRANHKENNRVIADKLAKAHAAGLHAILCVGETKAERHAGMEQRVVEEQIYEALPKNASAENTTIAYEPVWAIGTGDSASPEDIKVMHGFIREKLDGWMGGAKKLRILYGGSLKPANAAEILAIKNVDGGLIGGASLKAEDFLGIAAAV